MAAPPKIICIGLNYHDHALEQGAELPKEPLLFGKFASALIGPDEAIVLPPESAHVDAEAELVVVIDAEGRRVSEADALELVAGYTVANDVTARDLQRQDGQFTRAKGFDSFCPLGPWIETELDPTDLAVRTYVNGDLKQDGRTSDMIFGVPELIEYVSSVMTLLPGDVILTGTPEGVGPVQPDDEIEIFIEGIGNLTNKVKTRE
jgi:2-keto-4-pentenoate hydratase/2-oxohepta-3-ene-1,7-dioic acid hydratase in catechol pathway